MLHDPQGCQSSATNGLHFHADVLYFYELSGKLIRCIHRGAFVLIISQLNIHRFKVIARFGLMHVVATNICVWIRTLVLEYLKEITSYHKRLNTTDQAGGFFAGKTKNFHGQSHQIKYLFWDWIVSEGNETSFPLPFWCSPHTFTLLSLKTSLVKDCETSKSQSSLTPSNSGTST